MSEAPQVDILEASKETFVNLISELNDTQFHSFEQFVQSALSKFFIDLPKHDLFIFDIFLLGYRGISWSTSPPPPRR